MKGDNLYSIVYTAAGPHLILTCKGEELATNPGYYNAMRDIYFNFEEGKKVMVNWFLSRASSIDLLTEIQYNSFGKDLLNNKSFVEWLKSEDYKKDSKEADIIDG